MKAWSHENKPDGKDEWLTRPVCNRQRQGLVRNPERNVI